MTEETIRLIAKIEDILEGYSHSWINPLQYPDLKFDSSKAKEGLMLIQKLKEILQ